MVGKGFGGGDASVGAANGLLALAPSHAAAIHLGRRVAGEASLTTAWARAEEREVLNKGFQGEEDFCGH